MDVKSLEKREQERSRSQRPSEVKVRILDFIPRIKESLYWVLCRGITI